MFGTSTDRETWKPQWGPEPVVALRDIGTGRRRAPITLPSGAGAFGLAGRHGLG